MFWGEAFGSIFGDTDDAMDLFEAVLVGSSVRLTFKPKRDYVNRWYGVYLDGKLMSKWYVTRGQVVATILDAEDQSVIRVEDLGDLGDDQNYNPRFVAEYLCVNLPRFTIEWSAEPVQSIQGVGLINPELTGIDRFTNVERSLQGTDIGELSAVIVDDGSNAPTLKLWAGAALVASGAYEGSIASFVVTEENDSGIEGLIEYAPDTVGGNVTCRVLFRYPAKWRIYYQTTPFVSFDPEDYKVEISDRIKIINSYTTPNLDAGTYYVRVLGVNGDGVVDDDTTVEDSITVLGMPDPPTDLEYVSGDATATVIRFKHNGDGSSTYRLYASDVVDGPVDLHSIIDTAVEATDDYIEMTLDVAPTRRFYTDGDPAGYIDHYTGQRRVIVRAFDGIEELNVDELLINYDKDGAVVTRAPNACSIQSINVSSTGPASREMVLVATYSDVEEAAVATSIELYAWKVGLHKPELPVATGALTQGATLKYGSITYEFTELGDYEIAVAAVASGVSGPAAIRTISLSAGPKDVTNFRLRNG